MMTADSEQTFDQRPISRPVPESGLRGGPAASVERRGLFFDERIDMHDHGSRSSLPRVTHWSVAWSDLMMTMFILFLSMFVYQAAHKEFLVSDEVEVIGGDTAEALEIGGDGAAVFPFVPIKPGAPLMSVGSVKKVEPVRLQDIPDETAFFDDEVNGGRQRLEEAATAEQKRLDEAAETAQSAPTGEAALAGSGPDQAELSVQQLPVPAQADLQQTAEGEAAGESIAAGITAAETPAGSLVLTQQALEKLDLSEFASIDLVPDNTMRIILTGDLLFDLGQAELSLSARESLHKIAAVIKTTPYLINVVGHTDNVPMNSEKFASNWELSVARASRVARFLIEDMGMNPSQFVVSGYAAYRPIRANTNAGNRAVNRRVEIIISKKLAAPVTAAVETLTDRM